MYFTTSAMVHICHGGNKTTQYVANKLGSDSSPLSSVKLDKNYARRLKLRSNMVFHLGQLIAYDFYNSFWENIERNTLSYQKYAIKGASTQLFQMLCKLPPSGWDIEKFKIVYYKPYKKKDIFVIYGTHFDHMYINKSKGPDLIVADYRGSELMARVRRFQNSKDAMSVFVEEEINDNVWQVK